MKSLMILSIFCILLLIPSTATPTPALRCFIPYPNESLSERVKRELTNATAVFSGKVIAEEYRPVVPPTAEAPEGSMVLVSKILVDRRWKGDGKEVAEMYTSITKLQNGLTQTYAEDFHFEKAKSYLVYAFGQPDRLNTDVCKLTRKIEDAADQLRELGEGEAPKKKSQ
jgi:hypothetical protein